jgi:hypothetical protein
MPFIKTFLPLYTNWLQGRVLQCGCSMSEDDDDCGFVCIHHQAEEGDCFCQEVMKCQTCLYGEMGELLKNAHDELSAEEKASLVGRTAEEISKDDALMTPSKVSTVVSSMTALLLKRKEMAEAGPWEVEGVVDAQKIIDEVVALLWLPMVKGRMPCELKGCICVFNTIDSLIAPFLGLHPGLLIRDNEREQKGRGCSAQEAAEDEE